MPLTSGFVLFLDDSSRPLKSFENDGISLFKSSAGCGFSFPVSVTDLPPSVVRYSLNSLLSERKHRENGDKKKCAAAVATGRIRLYVEKKGALKERMFGSLAAGYQSLVK